jgi:Tripartite tricarboxylate transporter family receptor
LAALWTLSWAAVGRQISASFASDKSTLELKARWPHFPNTEPDIKVFAVTGKTRVMSAMEIPTVDEAGLPGLHVGAWFALFAPKGTPKDIVSKLNAEVRVLLADSTTRQRFAELGQDIPAPDQQSTEALAELQKAEIAKWWPIIKAANVKGEWSRSKKNHPFRQWQQPQPGFLKTTAALRDFKAYVRSGSKPEFTASQHFCPLHPNEQISATMNRGSRSCQLRKSPR